MITCNLTVGIWTIIFSWLQNYTPEIPVTVFVQENTLKDILGVVELSSKGSHIKGKKVLTLEELRAGSLKTDWVESLLWELSNNSTSLIGQLWEKFVKPAQSSTAKVEDLCV